MENKILWITFSPSPYRVDFFNELGKRCHLTVLFSVKNTSNRSEKWFKNDSDYFDKHFEVKNYSQFIKDKTFDYIVLSEFFSKKSIQFVRYLQKHKIPYILEADGAIYKKRNVIIQYIKKQVISKALNCYSSSESTDYYFKQYGAKNENIIRYHFTSLFEEDILRDVLSGPEKEEIKKQLNICEKRVVLTVGQFIHRKGFDVLLNSISDKSIGYYFVGGEPTDEYIEIVKIKDLKNVHFIGFCGKDTIKKYYQASDVFVLPTREDIWGLVVNEALANALPVISTRFCVAAQELIKNNGIIVEELESKKLNEEILGLIYNDELLGKYSKLSLYNIGKYTIEQMVNDHKLLFCKK